MNSLSLILRMKHHEALVAPACFNVSLAVRDKAMFNWYYDNGLYNDAKDALHELHMAQKRFEELK